MSDDLDTNKLLYSDNDYHSIELTPTHKYTKSNNTNVDSPYDDIDPISKNAYNTLNTPSTTVQHKQLHNADTVSVDTSPWIVRFIESIHPRAHYGYFAIPLCACTQVLANAGTTLGLGYYSDYLMSELNISRSLISGLFAVAIFSGSFIMPLIGRSIDKLGARFTALCALPFYVMTFVLFSYVNNVYMMVLVFLLFRIFKSVYQMYSSYIINQWFVSNKGIAMTIYQCLGTFGLLYPLLLTTIEHAVGTWRKQLLVMAVLHGVFGIILCSFGVNNPEHIGRLPDLKRHDIVQSSESPSSHHNHTTRTHTINVSTLNDGTDIADDDNVEIHWMYQDAIRTRLFLSVITANLTVALLWSGYNFNYKQMWRLQGITDNVENLFSIIAVFNFISLAIAGYIFDKLYNKGRGMAIGTIGCFLAVLFLSQSHTYTGAILFSVAMGFQDGIFATGYLTIFAYSFGRVDLGTIDSIAASIVNMIVGIGPFICGIVEDLYGSFSIVYYGLMMFSALATVSLVFSTKPNPPPITSKTIIVIKIR